MTDKTTADESAISEYSEFCKQYLHYVGTEISDISVDFSLNTYADTTSIEKASVCDETNNGNDVRELLSPYIENATVLMKRVTRATKFNTKLYHDLYGHLQYARTNIQISDVMKFLGPTYDIDDETAIANAVRAFGFSVDRETHIIEECKLVNCEKKVDAEKKVTDTTAESKKETTAAGPDSLPSDHCHKMFSTDEGYTPEPLPRDTEPGWVSSFSSH